MRDWRIYFEFAQRLIVKARALYASEDFGVELANTVYALDATTIDLCLSMFPWAPFRSAKAAVKLHTRLDLRGSIPTFIHISDGKLHDVNVLDLLIIEAGAFYIMDRGYLDFERLYALDQARGFFVTRAKRNLDARRLYSAPVDRSTGLISDHTIALNGFYAAKHYPVHLRHIRYRDPETGKTLVFLTNQFVPPALTICALYKCRWQVELFFKWIKQHLRIKRFYGTRVTSSSSAQGFAAGDGMPCHSQHIVCSSRTGRIEGNHPSSVSHLAAENKSAAATTNAVAAELNLLLGQFCEQGAGQF